MKIVLVNDNILLNLKLKEKIYFAEVLNKKLLFTTFDYHKVGWANDKEYKTVLNFFM